jgi:hypothetical protein
MPGGSPFKPGDQIIIKVANVQVTGHSETNLSTMLSMLSFANMSIDSRRSFQPPNVPGFRSESLDIMMLVAEALRCADDPFDR